MTVEVDIRTAAAWIPAGRFVMGDDRFYREEAPAHAVGVDGFWIDRAPVTNAEFRRFVAETGYVTVAEQVPDPRVYPGVAAEHLVPGSAVFAPSRTPVRLDEVSWWQYRRGACWHSPEGPGSSIEGREEHPVAHVAYHDAAAYAAWAGKRLPTEAEWEKAARGGLAGARYAWGDEAIVDGDVPANIWRGDFPHAPEGIWGTTTVGAFPANGFGLLDMIGNCWEWTSDRYEPGHTATCCAARDPRGPDAPDWDPLALGGTLRVLKGGSFLCAADYCARYRPAARIAQAEDASAANVGFRCASTDRTPPPPALATASVNRGESMTRRGRLMAT
jgi:formylglycine-generating enzyme required for sulfatase activity